MKGNKVLENNRIISLILSTAEKDIFDQTGIKMSLITVEKKVELEPETIIQIVMNTLGISYEERITKDKPDYIVIFRQICFYLIREYCQMPYINIGKLFNGYDHTSVMYGCKRVAIEQDAHTKLGIRYRQCLNSLTQYVASIENN